MEKKKTTGAARCALWQRRLSSTKVWLDGSFEDEIIDGAPVQSYHVLRITAIHYSLCIADFLMVVAFIFSFRENLFSATKMPPSSVSISTTTTTTTTDN